MRASTATSFAWQELMKSGVIRKQSMMSESIPLSLRYFMYSNRDGSSMDISILMLPLRILVSSTIVQNSSDRDRARAAITSSSDKCLYKLSSDRDWTSSVPGSVLTIRQMIKWTLLPVHKTDSHYANLYRIKKKDVFAKILDCFSTLALSTRFNSFPVTLFNVS